MTTSECRARLRAWLREHPDSTTAEVRAAMGCKRRRALLDLHAVGAVLTFDDSANSARWRLPGEVCAACGAKCWRDSVDVGTGVVYGPWMCSDCEERAAEARPWCVRIPGLRETWAYLLTSTGARAVDAAACFDRREEAEGLLADVRQHIAYKAPEATGLRDFARRLEQAEVIPLPEGVKPWGGV